MARSVAGGKDPISSKRPASLRRLALALTALFGALVVMVTVLWTLFNDASEKETVLAGLAAMAAYGAATGFLAFRAGLKTGPLAGHAPEILEALAVGVVLTDADFRVVQANPAFARMVGRDPRGLAGVSVRDCMYPGDRRTFEGEASRRREGKSDTYRVRLEGPGGAPVHVLIEAHPLFRDGKFTGSIGLIQDLSETVSARAEVAEARNLSGFLFDAFTHDLSNSLQVVMGRLAAASALARAGNPRAGQAAEAAMAAAERAAKELREIKQIAQAEKGDRPRTLRSAGEFVQEAIAAADVDPSVAVLTDLDWRAAAAHLGANDLGALALAKLVEEAASHGGSQALRTVTIELRAGELGLSTVIARVRGCRTTLPLDDIAAAMNSASEAPQGETVWRSGVRLVLAATIARPHGWTLSATRDADGVGTVFELRMPAMPGVPLEAPEERLKRRARA